MSNYQLNTKNTYFTLASETLKQDGAKHFKKILAIINPEVAAIDPWSPRLTKKEKEAVAQEAKQNIWYFLRECLKLNGREFIMTPYQFLLIDSMIKCRRTVNMTDRQFGNATLVAIFAKWNILRGRKNDIYCTSVDDRNTLVSRGMDVTLPDYLEVGTYIPTVLNWNTLRGRELGPSPILYSKVISVETMQLYLSAQQAKPDSDILFMTKRPSESQDSDKFIATYNELMSGRTPLTLSNTHIVSKNTDKYFMELKLNNYLDYKSDYSLFKKDTDSAEYLKKFDPPVH